MQISRHWRMNAQRYRLEGVQYENGNIAVQARHLELEQEDLPTYVPKSTDKREKRAAVTAA